MNKAAIFHRPLSEYAFAISENEYAFRLRTAKDDLKYVKFGFADRATMTPKFTFEVVPMECIFSNKYYDWYEVTIKSDFERIAYYFELNDGAETAYYYGDCFSDDWDAERPDYFQFAFNLRVDRMEVPEWVKGAVVYNIFPDSFADGKRHVSGQPSETTYNGIKCRSNLGGTIKGITENLDYLKDLGFNVVYLNPFFVATSYHKYDLIDYFHVDPCRGTDADFREMVDKAHAMGMKVLIDGVFNHTSSDHEFFRDVLEKGKDSKYFDCYYELGSDHPRFPARGEMPAYTCFAYVAHMPKTNTADPFLKDYFCKVGMHWIKEFDVDGWRLDVANEVDDAFLRAFRDAVKSVKKEAIVLGEIWENASHYVNGHMMEGAMNYDFRRYLTQYLAKESIDTEEFSARMENMLLRYPRQAAYSQLNLLDSHDVSRFYSVCDENLDKMEQAVLLLLTFPGMPSIFYGDEQGLTGVTEPEYRRPMIFEDKHPLFEIYKKLIALRNSSKTIQGGNFRTLVAKDGLYGFERNLGNESIRVYITSSKPATIEESKGEVILSKNLSGNNLGSYGYAVIKNTK